MQSKIQGISNGGSLNFQYSSNDNNCDFICKSNQVQKGCKYGFKCKVSSRCQSSICLCTMEMSCNDQKSIGGGLLDTFAGHSGNSATFGGGKLENSATFGGTFAVNSGNSATFDGNSGNSATLGGNSAISAQYLGLSKT